MRRLISDLENPDSAADLAVGTRGRLMLGTSPGKYGKHEPNAIPFDAVTFMIRAQLAANAVNADGKLLALDKRDAGDQTDAKDMRAITERTERLRALVGRTTNLAFVTQTELGDDEVEKTREEWDLECFRGTPNPSYWQRQTAVVLHTLGAANGHLPGMPLYKFGSVKGRDENGQLEGGEVDFDEYLPGEKGIKFLYAPPGYDVKGAWATPYLLDKSKQKERVCVPAGPKYLDRELNKLDAGVARITVDNWAATARVVLGQADASSLITPELTTMPLAAEHREIVRDAATIEELRELLRAALTKLCA